jgi:hypothetical protein
MRSRQGARQRGPKAVDGTVGCCMWDGIERCAGLTVSEEDRDGLRGRRWRPPTNPENWPESALSGEAGLTLADEENAR